MYQFVRPLLFKFNPEFIHEMTLFGLRNLNSLGLLAPFKANPPALPTKLMGLDLPNPVGLAAGLDKNGEAMNAFGALGFGYIEVGTVTPKPQPGNPKPRLFRLPARQAIVNRMGFNNHGVDALIENIKKAKFSGVLGVNIGKNATTPIEQAVDDYLICLEKLYPYADYIAVNISSPNTKNLRSLQNKNELNALLGRLKEKQLSLEASIGKYVPLAIKIAPDLSEEEVIETAAILLQNQVDGVIATNTTIDKTSIEPHPLSGEAGGLSGAPLTAQSNIVLQILSKELQNKLPIIGVGGIVEGNHAKEKIQLGAQAVQIYSGLIFQGPALIKDCVDSILELQ